jgi:hypothetical protein
MDEMLAAWPNSLWKVRQEAIGKDFYTLKQIIFIGLNWEI